VTNAGVANITKNLADQVAPDQILVNCIHPGTTRTPRQTMILERRARDMNVRVTEAERMAVQQIPLGRMVEPEDIAHLILFLVSTQASAITGQVIAVDGGAGRGMVY
jgi:NAD(P)-dependent dehydrogenase (short-subunit alcohol dehydrogenase family)